MHTASYVSIIVPVYNESASVEAVLRKVLASPIDKEVIVVNDGSTDATGEVLAKLKAELPIRVITHPKNLGKGQAILSGLAQSSGDIVLIQDADLEYDPGDYPTLLKPLQEQVASVVYGSRFLGTSRGSSGWHRLGNWILTAMVNLLFRSALTDVATCYKVFRRGIVKELSFRNSGFELEMELTCKLLRLGYPIVEVPVSYEHRTYAEGKKITWRDGIKAVWVMMCCRFNPCY